MNERVVVASNDQPPELAMRAFLLLTSLLALPAWAGDKPVVEVDLVYATRGASFVDPALADVASDLKGLPYQHFDRVAGASLPLVAGEKCRPTSAAASPSPSPWRPSPTPERPCASASPATARPCSTRRSNARSIAPASFRSEKPTQGSS